MAAGDLESVSVFLATEVTSISMSFSIGRSEMSTAGLLSWDERLRVRAKNRANVNLDIFAPTLRTRILSASLACSQSQPRHSDQYFGLVLIVVKAQPSHSAG